VSYLLALIGTVAAYVLLAILLLSLNIASLWRWWIKAGAIVLTALCFVGTYFAITGLIGWPSVQAVPDRFSLLAAKIVEPDKANGADGHLYLWVEEIDEANLAISPPRGHEVAYSVSLAKALAVAQQRLAEGQEVLGEMLEEEPEGEKVEETGTTPEQGDNPRGEEEAELAGGSGDRGAGGDGYLLDISNALRLSAMPAAVLPDKAP